MTLVTYLLWYVDWCSPQPCWSCSLYNRRVHTGKSFPYTGRVGNMCLWSTPWHTLRAYFFLPFATPSTADPPNTALHHSVMSQAQTSMTPSAERISCDELEPLLEAAIVTWCAETWWSCLRWSQILNRFAVICTVRCRVECVIDSSRECRPSQVYTLPSLQPRVYRPIRLLFEIVTPFIFCDC